jgi:hypothetical protein
MERPRRRCRRHVRARPPDAKRALSRPQVIPQESGLAGQSGEMAECVPAAPVDTADSLAGWPRGRRYQGVVVGPIIRCPWLDQVLEFVHRRQAAAMNHETGRPRTRLASERRVGQYQTRLASQAQRRRRRNARTASSTQPIGTIVTKTTQIGSGAGIVRPLSQRAVAGSILPLQHAGGFGFRLRSVMRSITPQLRSSRRRSKRPRCSSQGGW